MDRKIDDFQVLWDASLFVPLTLGPSSAGRGKQSPSPTGRMRS